MMMIPRIQRDPFVWGVWSDMIPTDNRCTSVDLKNGQKPQLFWIYFELHNGVQKGNGNIFDITPCLFCIN